MSVVDLKPDIGVIEVRSDKSSALKVATSDEGKARLYLRICAKLDHACRNLSPAFFSLNMGTGITSILLHNLPYNAKWLRIIGTLIFLLNVAIFSALVLGNIIRYTRYRLFTTVGKHLVSGMFWGCLPMGFATIVNMIAFVCAPAWGSRWARVALGLWWIDVILSIFVNFGMIYMIFTRHSHTPDTMAATWLLPIVSSVVAAASGGVVAAALAPFDAELARSTVIVSYIVWGTGVPLACFIMTLWIYRTAIGGIPAPAALPSVFLPLGPCGQGSFGIITLGKVIRELAYDHGVALAPNGSTESSLRIADAAYTGGIVTGLVLWGLGRVWSIRNFVTLLTSRFVWYTLAFAMMAEHTWKNRDFFWLKKFSVGFWALTFPIGVFATATTALATELSSPALRVIGTVLSLQVTLHWVYVSVMTAWKAIDGSIFVAPEIAQFNGNVPKRGEPHC